MMTTAPVLNTPRLVLRPHRLPDFEAMRGLWSDPDVTRFIGGRPSTREEVWARLLRYGGHWAMMGFGYWAFEDRASGAYVGEGGLMEARRAIDPSIEGKPEAGWSLMPAAQGRGFATEAMQAICTWADEVLRAPRLVCIISPANTPSLRVAAKLGFQPEAETTYAGSPTTIFSRLAQRVVD